MSRNDAPGWRDDRGGGGGGDSYRPGQNQSSYDNRWRPGDSRQHRNEGYDSYRGRESHRAPPHTDMYRPQVPQSDFTFRAPQPSNSEPIRFTAINGPRASGPRDRRGGGRRGDRRGGSSRGSGRPAWRPPHPAERKLVSGTAIEGPGERVNDPDAAAKFRNLDELSDDDEIAMDISDQEPESEDENPKKRIRTDKTSESDNSVPKWSNPDPYTALPCPDESTRKKRDMVKLIRKARVEETKPNTESPPEAENFIPIGMSSDEDEGEDEKIAPIVDLQLPARPPTGPRADRLDSASARATTGGAALHNGNPVQPNIAGATQDHSGPLGSRKRTADDTIKPPDYGQLKKGNMRPSKGLLVPNWQPKKNEEPCPWAVMDHSGEKNIGIQLHKEIIDFYEYVRPRDFEQRIRTRLVENLQRAMRRDGRNFASAEVRPFGSFMSGLYLPTADMDLVVCSASFMRGGPPTYLSAKSWLYKFQKFLVVQDVADGDSIEVIAHARIPLVKFVDKATGLKVDVSFENLGGVRAVDTFLKWKEDYPAMPILVTVVKHFLLMRGLNEPVNGGIGGFTVICLVVSMLQMNPEVQSRTIKPEHHLGDFLLDFLDLYGRHFEHEANAISLTSPIGYINKNKVKSLTYRNRDRLSIIDPNNSSNDISGGSSNTPAILARFHDAYLTLTDRMNELQRHPGSTKGGILDVILRGDYSSFRMQRAYLKLVHEKTIGPCSDQD
ncbi:Polynucleotide adenylyltransferase [Purpureocillium takamizusanense]|uniref:polynucleotide adenylyltransferase n=1 Tax=Purpureocillium takamizusanense TaxID=2060973 RepID=A0A9Q8QMK5_9HYPO|nr:Polynucleotide adenylyltransferase [Purpureocillium takamizusanense]UNI22843.1 Polynucleotide adenylyltransferase [Purpureocillium takamizusanense]